MICLAFAVNGLSSAAEGVGSFSGSAAGTIWRRDARLMRGVFKGQPTFFTRHSEQLSKGSWHGCGAHGDSIAAGCDEIFSPASTHAPLAAWMRSKKTETVTGLRSRVSEGWKFKLTLPHRGRV
jgi:hypothetical protein